MSGTVDERLAAALHGIGLDCFDVPWRGCGAVIHEREAANLIAALADSGVVLVEREALVVPASVRRRDGHWRDANATGGFDGVTDHPDTMCSADADRCLLVNLLDGLARSEDPA